jgi:hypothetical protein
MGKPALYQRLRAGHRWKKVTEWFKNGQPKTDPAAYQFGARFTVNGQRYFDTFTSLDDAMTRLKQAEVMVHAAKAGLAGRVFPRWRKERCRQDPHSVATESWRH